MAGFKPSTLVFHDYGGTPQNREGVFNPYHALVFPDGSLQYRNPDNPYGAPAPHAYKLNPESIGLSYAGQVGSRPTPAAMETLRKEAQKVSSMFPGIRPMGHGEAFQATRGTNKQASRDGRDLVEASWRSNVVYGPPAPGETQVAAGPVPVSDRSLTAFAGLTPKAQPNQRMSLGGPMPAKQQTQTESPSWWGDINSRLQNPLFLGGLGMLVAANQGQDAASALNSGLRTGAGLQDQMMQNSERQRERAKQQALEEFWNSYDPSQLPAGVAGVLPGLSASQKAELVLQNATGQLPTAEDADLKRRKMQAEIKRLESPTAGAAPKFVVVNGRLVRAGPDGVADVTPETANKQDPMGTFFGREQAKADFKTINDYRADSDGAAELRGNLDALRKARSETDMEGPIMGLLPALTSAQQAVDSTAENVRLGFVAKTKGAVSDAEMRIFGMATPGRRMRDEAAKTIIDGMDLAAQRTQEQAVFFDEWMRQNGNLNGAQAAWQSYINSNPIIAEKDGKFVLSPQNVGNWRQFFSGGQGQAPQGARTAQPQQGGKTAPTPQAIEALRQNANNPQIIQQFEQKYGVPASQFLGR